MKLTKKMCYETGIHNDYDYSLGRLYICYLPGDTGQLARSPRWSISKRGHRFDGHWMDYGNKVFNVWTREDKQKKLEEAIEFARIFMKYPDAEFVKNPFSSYMLKSFVELRNKQILSMIKEKEKSKK